MKAAAGVIIIAAVSLGLSAALLVPLIQSQDTPDSASGNGTEAGSDIISEIIGLLPIEKPHGRPDMRSEISIPAKIVRGGEFTAKIRARNFGSATAHNVTLEIIPPEGFVPSPRSIFCEAVEVSGSCAFNSTVAATTSAALGETVINARVSHAIP